MDEYQATVEVGLPPAPPQKAPQKNRMVIIKGSAGQDGSREVEVSSTGPLTIKAGLNSIVTIDIVEVLVNNKPSPPASVQFVPIDYIEATAADPAAFSIKVVSVDKLQVNEPIVATGPDAAAAEVTGTSTAPQA